MQRQLGYAEGEGAILNSKGEFSRRYIPRLQMEEEQVGEERAKMLEEIENQLVHQDEIWEQRRGEELGANAIKGLRSSPLKRVETTAPWGVQNKRRKLLKYPCLGEDLRSQLFPPCQGSSQPIRLLLHTQGAILVPGSWKS